MKNEIDFIMKLHVNVYFCPRCGATMKIPIDTPGQKELFAPNCYNCGEEMRESPF